MQIAAQGEGTEQAAHQTHVVVEGQPGHKRIRRVSTRAGADVLDVGQERPVGDADRLRVPGGAAGQLEEGQGLRVPRRRRRPCRGIAGIFVGEVRRRQEPGACGLPHLGPGHQPALGKLLQQKTDALPKDLDATQGTGRSQAARDHAHRNRPQEPFE